jgi:hypothetical protein
MPTTIYDSSLLTQRKRDKLIAQQIRQANNAGQPIIVPQTGYASYYGGEADNGAITYFRKVGECTNVNVSCNCAGQITTASVSSNINNPQYIITVDATVELLNGVELNGSGTIYWGDGNTTPFNTGGILVFFNHTYDTPGLYTITITAFITELVLASDAASGNQYYLDASSVTLINPEDLTTLNVSCPNLTTITGLSGGINLTYLAIGNNSCNIDDIYTLSQLQTLELNTRPTPTSFDASSFTQLQVLILQNSAITTLTNLPNTLTGLNVSNCTSLTSLVDLPTSLTEIEATSTGIVGIVNLTGLNSLELFYCNNSAGITGLGTLPSSLTTLRIDNSGINSGTPGIFDLTGLINLTIFGCANCVDVTGLGTLPTTLTILEVGGAGINSGAPGIFDISSLLSLSLFNCTTCVDITGLGTLPTSLTTLEVGGAGINSGAPGIFDISSLTGLTGFECLGCIDITGLGTPLPPSLDSLTIGASGISGVFNISSLSNIVVFNCGNCSGITGVDITGCSLLEYIEVSSCAITLVNADAIGAALSPTPPSGAQCIIDGASQTPSITIDINNPPWSDAITNGWDIIE